MLLALLVWPPGLRGLQVRSRRTPLDLGRTFDHYKTKTSSEEFQRDNTYLQSRDSAIGKNASRKAFTGNPDEYTIGGVLSGASDVEFYFTQVLSVSRLLTVSAPWWDTQGLESKGFSKGREKVV